MADRVLEVENLHTQFHVNRGVVKAVDGVDLTIESGEVVGLVGESGSGKSVLAESIVGIVEEPGEIVEGDVWFNGRSMLEMSDEEREQIRGGQISMVFQDPMNSLNPTIPVGEQIAETVRLHQDVGESVSLSAEMKRKIVGAAKNGQAWRRAIEMLEAVEIPEPEARATDFPHEFSGGMRQRAMIAMALSCEPDLLVADEPTTALDVTIQAQILELLRDIQAERDMSILLITHDLGVIARMSDRVCVMYAGEVVERGTLSDIFEESVHPYTRGLIGSIPDLENPAPRLQPIEGSVPSLLDAEMGDRCYFADRCPKAMEYCLEKPPEFDAEGEEHGAKCVLAERPYSEAVALPDGFFADEGGEGRE
jgi:oligopeptide/dipeptide ABC transporter ATP-binding protein